MGVRKNDRPLHDAVERAIAARRSDIALILREYAVPIVSATGTPAKAAR
jgi:hypothetical protein